MSDQAPDQAQPQPQPQPPPGPTNDDLEPLVLPTLKRGWAKGARNVFLSSKLESYCTALKLKRGRSSANEVQDTIVRDYFRTFHWSLPLTEEPPPGHVGVDPNGPPETLTPQEERMKQAVIVRMKTSIHAWLDYRAKKINTAPNKEDPLQNSLSKFDDSTGSKLRTGWEYWGKLNWDSIKSQLPSNISKSQRANECNILKKRQFALLSAESQAFYNAEALRVHTEAKEKAEQRKDAPVLLSPADAQIAIDGLAASLGPWVRHIGETLGMHVSLFVGGPEPSKRGQINMISLHHGVDKGPVPKVWALADPSNFKIVKELFTRYLVSCYTPEEQRARSLIPIAPFDLTAQVAKVMGGLDAPVNPVATQSTLPETGGASNAEKTSDSLDSEKQKGGLKRKRTAGRKSSERLQNKKKKQTSKQGRGRGKGRGKKRKRAQEEEEEEEEEEESDEESDEESSGDEEREVRRHPISRKTITKSVPKLGPVFALKAPRIVPTTTRAPPSPSPTPRTPLPTSPGICIPPRFRTTIPGGEQNEAAAGGQERLGSLPSSLPVPSGLPNGQMAPATGASQPPAPRRRPTTAEMSSWPAWLSTAYPALSIPPHSSFTALLDRYIAYETQSTSVATSSSFGKQYRPDEVGVWLSRSRKTAPDVNAAVFSLSWWMWWKGLQPNWRGVSTVQGSLGREHRRGTGDWGAMRKHGQNGYLTVLSTLCWWYNGLEGGDESDWLEAVADVTWVMEGILGAGREGATRPTRKRVRL